MVDDFQLEIRLANYSLIEGSILLFDDLLYYPNKHIFWIISKQFVVNGPVTLFIFSS